MQPYADESGGLPAASYIKRDSQGFGQQIDAWHGREPSLGRAETASGLPSYEVLSGRSLSSFVDAIPPRALETPNLLQPSESFAVQDPAFFLPPDPHMASLDPGGGLQGSHVATYGNGGGEPNASGTVAPGLRQAWGRVLTPEEQARLQASDPLYRRTGFHTVWGTPPDSDLFAWDNDARVYRPQMRAQAYYGGGEPGEAARLKLVLEHHRQLARRGIHLQAYRPGGKGSAQPWAYRWVRADLGREPWEQSYEVVSEGYGSQGYRGPSAQEIQADLQAGIASQEERRAREASLRAYGLNDLADSPGLYPATEPSPYTSDKGRYCSVYRAGPSGVRLEQVWVPWGSPIPTGANCGHSVRPQAQ